MNCLTGQIVTLNLAENRQIPGWYYSFLDFSTVVHCYTLNSWTEKFVCKSLVFVYLVNTHIVYEFIHSFTKVKTYRLLCELHFLCCRYKMWNWNVHYSVLISVTDQSTVYLWSLLITLIKIALCGPGAIPLIRSLCNLLLYLLVSFTFTFRTCFIYFLAFTSLPILPE